MSAQKTTRKQALRNRLSSYWKMEVANVVIVPVFMAGWCLIEGQPVGWLLLATCVPMCALLWIGGLYWRAKLHQLEGRTATLRKLLPRVAQMQIPAAIASIAASLIAAGAWFVPSLSLSFGERLAASFAGALAVLEYVNYYHRQLQNFDHVADLKRFFSGGGFRRAQMAQDLARWRFSAGVRSV